MGAIRLPGRSPFPEFAWSESRARRFLECRRSYYLSVYQAHDGWLPGAPGPQRLAWMLSRLVPSWRTALGTVVHEAAARCVRSCLNAQPLPAFSELRRSAGACLNQIFASSRRLEGFWRSPSRFPALASRFYGEPWDLADLSDARSHLDYCLASLLALEPLWKRVRTAGPERVWLPPRWVSFPLSLVSPAGAVRILGAPDLVLRESSAAPVEIWDWKTGSADGAVDAILTYGLALSRAAAVPPSIRVSSEVMLGRLIHLGQPDGCPDAESFRVEPEDLDGAVARIERSVVAMRAGLKSPERNEPLPEAFPRTPDAWRCRRCSYRGICHPDLYPIVEPEAARRPMRS